MAIDKMNRIVPLSQFDLEGFIAATVEYLNIRVQHERIDPFCAIPVVEADGKVPGWAEEQPARDLLAELIKLRKTLFVPFSDSNLGEPIFCADGKYYEFDEPDEFEDKDLANLAESDHENIESDLYMGDVDGAGYIISIDEAHNLHIRAGMLYGGGCMRPPMIELDGVPLIFVTGMEKFIDRFIKK